MKADICAAIIETANQINELENAKRNIERIIEQLIIRKYNLELSMNQEMGNIQMAHFINHMQ